MKKYLFIVLFLLSGCTSSTSSRTIYEDINNGCLYTEDLGYLKHFVFNSNPEFFVKEENSIFYPNTTCKTIIEYDLKNANNKTLIENPYFIHGEGIRSR